MKCSDELTTALITIAASIVSGALAGAIAGWTFASLPGDRYMYVPLDPQGLATSTEPVREVELVEVDRSRQEPIVPPAFTNRRTSPVASVYVRPARQSAVLSEADLLGQAMAVTSDGWFVTPEGVLDGYALAGIVVWHNGSAATATRAIRDERGGVVFLKTDIANVSAPAFARYQDVNRGLSVWAERRTGSFENMVVSALGEEVTALSGVSSDLAARRPMLNGIARSGDMGAPVWGTNGTLIGIMQSEEGERIRYIPVTAWAPSLFGIFSDGEIRHAALGVRSVDISNARVLRSEETFPSRGAWIMPDSVRGLPAIAPDSPAANAGLLEGDVILQVDRDILDGRADLGEVLVQYKPGSNVTLTVYRDGETLEIPATLGSKVMSEEVK